MLVCYGIRHRVEDSCYAIQKALCVASTSVLSYYEIILYDRKREIIQKNIIYRVGVVLKVLKIENFFRSRIRNVVAKYMSLASSSLRALLVTAGALLRSRDLDTNQSRPDDTSFVHNRSILAM